MVNWTVDDVTSWWYQRDWILLQIFLQVGENCSFSWDSCSY